MRPSRIDLGLAAACLLAGGCDIPTDVPLLEHRWQIPVEETSLGVDELLPTGVSVQGGNFSVAVDPITTSRSLGSLCSVCISSGGVPVFVPPFSGSFSSSSDLPVDVSDVVVAGGSVQVAIQNGFSFDPLAGGGTLTITLRDGPAGVQLGQVTLDGDVESLAAGSTTTRTVTIGQGVVQTSIYASVAVTSDGGQLATISTSDQMSITATLQSLLVSSATVGVSGTSVDFDAVDIDVEGLDSDVTDRIEAGVITLDVVNPFGVAVNGSILLGPVSKNFVLTAAPTSTVTLAYTGDELRSFLGQAGVQFSGSGTVSGGAVTVSPAQRMTLKATLDFTILIG